MPAQAQPGNASFFNTCQCARVRMHMRAHAALFACSNLSNLNVAACMLALSTWLAGHVAGQGNTGTVGAMLAAISTF
eukprot:359406-Chlamydomonas_euryale.AAC.4